MEVLDAISHRRSIRGYTGQPIGEEAIKTLLEAANWAPSGHRIFAWKLAIVEQAELIEQIRNVSPGMHDTPPALLILCRDKQKEKQGVDTWEWRSEKQRKMYDEVVASFISIKGLVNLLSVMDISMAAQNICLAATDLGIGSCIVSVFHPVRVRKLLGLPLNIVPLLLIPLGYPVKIPPPPPRRRAEDAVICWVKGE